MRSARRNVRVFFLRPEQEERADQYARQGRVNALIEAAARLAFLLVERHYRRDVLFGDGPTERTLRQRRDDPLRARRLVRFRFRATNEDPRAARRFADAGHAERAFDDAHLEPDRKSTRLNSSHVKISY